MISNRMILAISCIVLLAGCALIYCFNNDDYKANVEFESGEIRYTLDGFLPCDYTCKVYSNTDVPERLYFYYDEGYIHYYDHNSQKRFFTDMERVLKARDYSSIQYIDAVELKTLIDDPANAIKSEIIFVSGSIPDTIYNDTEMRLTEWMDNGGAVMWSGPEIGLYVSHTNGYAQAENGRILKGHVNDGTEQREESISELGLATGFTRWKSTMFGLEKDYPGSTCLSVCSKDYSSFSVMEYSNGRMFIMGGNLSDTVLPMHTSLAEIIICGITENTTVKYSETFKKGYGGASGTIQSVSAGDTFLLTVGKPYSSWARSYTVL